MKHFSSSNFNTLLITHWTKFESVLPNDVGGDRIQAMGHVLRQTYDFRRYDFLLAAPMVLILVCMRN